MTIHRGGPQEPASSVDQSCSTKIHSKILATHRKTCVQRLRVAYQLRGITMAWPGLDCRATRHADDIKFDFSGYRILYFSVSPDILLLEWPVLTSNFLIMYGRCATWMLLASFPRKIRVYPKIETLVHHIIFSVMYLLSKRIFHMKKSDYQIEVIHLRRQMSVNDLARPNWQTSSESHSARLISPTPRMDVSVSSVSRQLSKNRQILESKTTVAFSGIITRPKHRTHLARHEWLHKLILLFNHFLGFKRRILSHWLGTPTFSCAAVPQQRRYPVTTHHHDSQTFASTSH